MACLYGYKFGTDFMKKPYCDTRCKQLFDSCKKYNDMTQRMEKIKAAIHLTEDWCKDQSTEIPESQICMAALKDIRRIIKGV